MAAGAGLGGSGTAGATATGVEKTDLHPGQRTDLPRFSSPMLSFILQDGQRTTVAMLLLIENVGVRGLSRKALSAASGSHRTNRNNYKVTGWLFAQ